MEGYNVLIPDLCKEATPEITLPAMDALQALGHTPVVMNMAAIATMYRQMRYERHGCYDIFQFYVRDLFKQYKADFGFSVGLGMVLEDTKKKEAHNLLEECDIPALVYFHGRDPRVSEKLDQVGASMWKHTFFCCSCQGLVDALQTRGFSKASLMLPATNRRIFFPADNVPTNAAFPVQPDDPWLAKDYDVSFAGSYTRKREELLTALADAGVSLAIWGDQQWKKSDQLRPYFRNNCRYLADMNTVYNASKINLDLCHDDTIFPDYVSLRVLDCMATGGFMLSQNRPGLAALAEPGREIAVFNNQVELVKLVRYYLENDLERQTIASRASIRVSTGASWADRLNQILPQLEMHLLKVA